MVPPGVGEGHVFQRRPVAAHQVQVPGRRHPPPRRLRRLPRGEHRRVILFRYNVLIV